MIGYLNDFRAMMFCSLLVVAVPAAPIGPRCERAFTLVFAG